MAKDLTVAVPDTVRELAMAELLQETKPEFIGEELAPEQVDDATLTLRFKSLLPGYPGWNWTVTLNRIDTESMYTVSEVGLMAGEDSLIAPEWVPWAERLKQFRQAQAEQEAILAENVDESDALDEFYDDVDTDAGTDNTDTFAVDSIEDDTNESSGLDDDTDIEDDDIDDDRFEEEYDAKDELIAEYLADLENSLDELETVDVNNLKEEE